VVFLFFAPEALLSSFEVVIRALTAFPSSFWEVEFVFPLFHLGLALSFSGGLLSQDLGEVGHLNLLECGLAEGW
jgi:hypothetical protein